MSLAVSPLGSVTIVTHESQDASSFEIQTNRLKIVSVTTDEYSQQLVDLYGSQTVNKLVGSGATLERDQVIAKIERWKTRWSQNNPFSGFVVIEKESGDFVGQIILKPVKDKTAGPEALVPGMAEIGYLSVPKHWGKKYCQEYTGAILDHFVPKLVSLHYQIGGKPLSSVMATARVDNTASNKVLRKFMTYTGTKDRYNGPREWYERKYV
jgi:RimJ/RimL family protein N-acetyltransferase